MFEVNQLQIQFGIALCYYKMEKYSKSSEIIDQLIACQDEMFNQKLLLYLRALSYKRRKMYQESQNDYQHLEQFARPSNFDILADFMFAIIFAEKRSMKINFDPITFCQFHTVIQRLVKNENISTDLILQQYWNEEKQKWDSTNSLEIAQKIQSRSFFKRYGVKLIEENMDCFKYFIVQPNSVIFVKEGTTNIIVSGDVVSYDHRQNFDRPKIVAYYQQGDIIGAPQFDNSFCLIPDIWFVAKSVVEVISIEKECFNELWQVQIQMKKDLDFQFISNHPLFNRVSELTLYKISYELMKVKKYTKNRVIYNDQTYMKKYGHLTLTKTTKEEKKQQIDFSEGFIPYKPKLKTLILKHKKVIDQLKYNRKKQEGLFIIKKGVCEIESPFGFNSVFITVGDFVGESLLFQSSSISQYGRIRTSSEEVECLFISRFDFDKINDLDLEIMKTNCKDRKEVSNLSFIHLRQNQIKDLKSKNELNNN